MFWWKKNRANDMFANIKTPDRTALEKEAQEFEEYIRQKRSTQLKDEDESVSLEDDATNIGKKNQQSSENLVARRILCIVRNNI